MTANASRDDLLRMRLASQLLSATGARPGAGANTAAAGAGAASPGGNATGAAPNVAAVARRMLAVQGQDPVAAQWALGIRSPGSTVADVWDAQRRGEIVRSWPMRGTVHLVPAEDIGWMQQLLTPRLLNDAVRRREMLGLPLETLDRMRAIAIERLAGGGQATRADLLAWFAESGIEMLTGWSYHAVWWLCQTGTLVFGPPIGARDAALVLVEEWIPEPRRLEGDDALAELGARYLAGHGPATPADLAWWTKLPLGAARKAFAFASERDLAVPLAVDDEQWWVAPGSQDAVPQAPDVLLLPGFDELLLGYRDRTLSADPRHTPLFASSNGIFAPTVMLRGRAVGTWKLSAGRVVVTPFADEEQPAPAALAEAAAAVERFYA